MKEQIESYIDSLCAEFDKVDWSDRRAYAAYCAQIYYYVSHSTRLLAFCGGLMSLADQTGHHRFIDHLHEEKNHELLAKKDCESLGFKVEDFPELESTKAFYQNQYYLAMMRTPWAFVGYALILEGLAVKKCLAFHDHVTKLHGPKCASFMKIHGEEDEDHFPEALRMLEARSPAEREAILESAQMSAYFHTLIVRETNEAVRRMRKGSGSKKAA